MYRHIYPVPVRTRGRIVAAAALLAGLLLAIAPQAVLAGPTFSVVPLPVGHSPGSFVVTDFNDDGIPDIAIANQTDKTVSVLIGNGNGTFHAATGSPTTFPVTTKIAAADVNGDGKADLLVLNQPGNQIYVRLGNGDGTFAATSITTSMATTPTDFAVGDFNHDGRLDIALTIANDNTVKTLVGGGDGTFTAGTSISAGGISPFAIKVTDLNGDGFPDIVEANVASNTVSVFLGNGTGGFSAAPASPIAVGLSPFSVAVGDLNGDGKIDLAVANYGDNTNPGSISVLLGNGSGGFSAVPGSPFTAGVGTTSVAIGDVDGDGKADLVVSDFVDNNLLVFLGTGTGAFGSPTPFAVGVDPISVRLGDFNRDGKPDVIVGYQNSAATNVTLLTNTTSPFPNLTPHPVNVTPSAGSGFGGTPITITGSGFQSGATVFIGTILCDQIVVSPDGKTITCTTPSNQMRFGFEDVRVANTGGDAGILVDGFLYHLNPAAEPQPRPGVSGPGIPDQQPGPRSNGGGSVGNPASAPNPRH